MMRGKMRRLIWSIAIAGSALAQRPAFEVASVKPSPMVPFGQNININLGAVDHNKLTLTNTTLCESLRFAYHLVSDDQVAGPDWIKDREFRYDVVAKGPVNATREQLLEMLQTLLDERFNLAMHREPRIVAHYELVVAKRGLKIHPSKPDAPADVKYSRGHFSSQWMPMFRFTMLLSRQLRQAVIDKSGLTGPYDIDLEWTPDEPNGALPEVAGPSIFSAIQDQLGLRLEAHKSPIEALVVDRAEKAPVAN
jgi:uncharacterized protein (TIGR03435 family)